MVPLPLFCLPPAGAGPSLFRKWHATDNSVVTPSLPGRETRIRDPLPDSLVSLADLLADEIAPTLPAQYAWFGYSMGATLTYEITRRLDARGGPLPQAMFVLASNPPNELLRDPVLLHQLDSEAFWAELGRIGGTPDDVLAHPEIRELFEPILRADFRNCEEYEHRADGFRLSCPLHVFVADQDHMVSVEDAAGWQEFTTGPMALHTIRGRHMLNEPAFLGLLSRINELKTAPLPLPV